MVKEGSDLIVWIDSELTGLDLTNSVFLEVACVITDKKLKVVSTEFNVVIHQPDTVLESMDSWCINTHTKTGLIQESKDSKITIMDAERMLLTFLKNYIPKEQCPLAGNTVYMDRIFLKKFMPTVDAYLHYRIIDVSTVKELIRRWNPIVYKNVPEKLEYHRALPDIKESIQELTYYKEHIFTHLID